MVRLIKFTLLEPKEKLSGIQTHFQTNLVLPLGIAAEENSANFLATENATLSASKKQMEVSKL